MITFNRLGTLGRLGNQLFQIASVTGIALKNGYEYAFPEWKYSQYFETPLPKTTEKKPVLPEKTYHYTSVSTDNISLDGWYQTSTYWQGHEKEIKQQFKLKELCKIPWKKDRETIGLMILDVIISNAYKASNEVIEFVAAYKGITPGEAEQLDFVVVMKEIFKETGILNFFK